MYYNNIIIIYIYNNNGGYDLNFGKEVGITNTQSLRQIIDGLIYKNNFTLPYFTDLYLLQLWYSYIYIYIWLNRVRIIGGIVRQYKWFGSVYKFWGEERES